jgi:hypothetical protein
MQNSEEKRQRLVGMAAFSLLAIFLLWHVSFEYRELRLVGMQTNPWGYGSPAYRLIREIATENHYSEEPANLWWFSTQLIPILVAWGLRMFLGRCVAIASLAAKFLYSRI